MNTNNNAGPTGSELTTDVEGASERRLVRRFDPYFTDNLGSRCIAQMEASSVGDWVEFEHLQDERTMSDTLASAIMGMYPVDQAMRQYAETLSDSSEVEEFLKSNAEGQARR